MFNTGKYILDDDGNPVLCEDLYAWAYWMDNPEHRRVFLTKVTEDIKVSTVFLGLDHNWYTQGPPILFETMVFGGHYDQYQERYATRIEAQMGHDVMVQMVRMQLESIRR